MSLHPLKPSLKFHDQVKTLALMGYTQAHEVDEADLAPVARAWLIENVDLSDHDDQKTRALPWIWTRSVCSRVLEWSEFHQDCNAVLFLASRQEPLQLAEELYQRLERRISSHPAQVLRFPHPAANDPTLGGPAA